MKIQIECRTRFDITATGIRSNYRSHQIPCQDDNGQEISDLVTWTRARNQQRNWDTINQIISLRSLPENISQPKKSHENNNTYWKFSFDIMDPAAVGTMDDPVALLVADCRDVPMISGLDEDPGTGMILIPGLQGNISFSVVHDK